VRSNGFETVGAPDSRSKAAVSGSSASPVLKMSRVVPEALALDLPAGVLERYLHDNAEEFFFGERH